MCIRGAVSMAQKPDNKSRQKQLVSSKRLILTIQNKKKRGLKLKENTFKKSFYTIQLKKYKFINKPNSKHVFIKKKKLKYYLNIETHPKSTIVYFLGVFINWF
ncbi:unnamed protein product [Prunus armeniaca]